MLQLVREEISAPLPWRLTIYWNISLSEIACFGVWMSQSLLSTVSGVVYCAANARPRFLSFDHAHDVPFSLIVISHIE